MTETEKAPESPTPREDELEDEDAADAVSLPVRRSIGYI
jgi:hypothetical protein